MVKQSHLHCEAALEHPVGFGGSPLHLRVDPPAQMPRARKASAHSCNVERQSEWSSSLLQHALFDLAAENIWIANRTYGSSDAMSNSDVVKMPDSEVQLHHDVMGDVDCHSPVQSSGFRTYAAADVGYDRQTWTNCKWRDRNDWFLQPHGWYVHPRRRAMFGAGTFPAVLYLAPPAVREDLMRSFLPFMDQGLCLKAMLQRGSHQAEVETISGKSSLPLDNLRISRRFRDVLKLQDFRKKYSSKFKSSSPSPCKIMKSICQSK